MRSAIGNSLLLNLVIIFVSLVMLFFVGILSYSKAYKAKNRIIEIIETSKDYDEIATSKIEQDLHSMGYSISKNSTCKDEEANMNKSTYRYCVYLKPSSRPYTDEGLTKPENSTYYYEVITYVHFDIPFIGDAIDIPIKGETKTLGKNYNYE